MSWQTAVVGAIGAATYKQQGKIGKFNEAVGNRNAEILEQERVIDATEVENWCCVSQFFL